MDQTENAGSQTLFRRVRRVRASDRPYSPPPLIRRCNPCARKSASQAVLSRMQLTLHVTRRTPHAASRLVLAMTVWSVKTRLAPSRHCRDARVYGRTTTAMHDNEYTPARARAGYIVESYAIQGSLRTRRRGSNNHIARSTVRTYVCALRPEDNDVTIFSLTTTYPPCPMMFDVGTRTTGGGGLSSLPCTVPDAK